jgi:hypothetical protein
MLPLTLSLFSFGLLLLLLFFHQLLLLFPLPYNIRILELIRNRYTFLQLRILKLLRPWILFPVEVLQIVVVLVQAAEGQVPAEEEHHGGQLEAAAQARMVWRRPDAARVHERRRR